MIKRLIEGFDASAYTKQDISSLQESDCVKLSGTLAIAKKSGASGDYYNISLSNRKGKANANIFAESPLFPLLSGVPSSAEGILYGKVGVNGKYINVSVDNIDYYVEDMVDVAEMNPVTSSVYAELSSYTALIDDGFLRNVVANILTNEKIIKKFLMAPASEFSAYSWLGGLAQMTLQICRLTNLIVSDTSNNGNNILGVDKNMLLASALLCNIGRAYMYDISPDGKFFKNDYAVLDTDYSLTRDAIKKSIADTFEVKDEDGGRLFAPATADTIKELIHIIDTSKSLLSGNGAAPRTRNACVFAGIVGMVNYTGTFDKLERSNIGNEKIVKAFDGGKCYFIPSQKQQ